MSFRDFLKRIMKVKNTILNDIWMEVLFFTAVAVLVTTLTKLANAHLTFSNQLMTVLGTALGFVISFRTSTAYERFTEGRLRWTDISILSRTLAQIIWLHVPVNRDKADQALAMNERGSDQIESEGHNSVLEVYIEKKSIINLVLAFSVSVKHLLRGESGVYYKDLYPLIAFLPRFHTEDDHAQPEDMLPLWKASKMDYQKYKTFRQDSLNTSSLRHVGRTGSMPFMDSKEVSSDDSREIQSLPEMHKYHKFDPESALPNLSADQELRPAKDIPASFFRHYVVPFCKWLVWPFTRLSEHQSAHRSKRTALGKKINHQSDSNVPMEIATFLLSYHSWLLEHKYTSDFAASNIYGNIVALQNAVVHLERIKNTPLPFAYQAHLRISVWMYLFFLPSQLYNLFSPVWLTIPATAISAFIMLGFLEIGQEIENPFNYDETDLDLDEFCYAIQRELHEVTAHTNPHPQSYIFSHWNQPFAPADRRSAPDIISDPTHPYHSAGDKGVHHIRKTMLQCWEHVDNATRHKAHY